MQRHKRHDELLYTQEIKYLGSLKDARRAANNALAHLNPTSKQYQEILKMTKVIDTHQALFTGDVRAFWLKDATGEQFPG